MLLSKIEIGLPKQVPVDGVANGGKRSPFGRQVLSCVSFYIFRDRNKGIGPGVGAALQKALPGVDGPLFRFGKKVMAPMHTYHLDVRGFGGQHKHQSFGRLNHIKGSTFVHLPQLPPYPPAILAKAGLFEKTRCRQAVNVHSTLLKMLFLWTFAAAYYRATVTGRHQRAANGLNRTSETRGSPQGVFVGQIANV